MPKTMNCVWILLAFVIGVCRAKYNITSNMVVELWNGDNPFNYANNSYIDHGYPHTNIQIEIIDAVLAHAKPTLWVEAGSMLGGSVIKTAERIKLKGFDVSIISIDPFTGDVNMLMWEHGAFLDKNWRFLRNENGRPRIYDRFIANIREAGHGDMVVPVCASAIVGLRFLKNMVELKRLETLPEVIYLDSAHEADETFLELLVAWHSLKSNGILFGDDWSWHTVRFDVLKFAQTVQNEISAKTLETMKSELPTAVLEGGVLVVKGQWILAKQ